MSYDAITNLNGDTYIFKGIFMWKVDKNGPQPGTPTQIRNRFRTLPANLTKVDAVYQYDNRIVKIFAGKTFYDFRGVRLLKTGTLTDLGISATINKIDAFFQWGQNHSTVIFSGNNFWRFDEATQMVVDGYPYTTDKAWRNVGLFDTAFKKDGKTYFFKGLNFFEFDDHELALKDKRGISAQYWMKC